MGELDVKNRNGLLESGGLRLDLADEAVDEFGFSAIVPGDAAGSELIRRLTHKSPKRLML